MPTPLMPASAQKGHMLALFSVVVWGATFISTKVLLKDFRPVEILFIRISLAILALFIARPRFLTLRNPRHHLLFAGAGLCGVTLYFLFENMALTYTYPANCSVIISTAPFFVAMASHWFVKSERIRLSFIIGFAVSMAGICLLSFSGQALRLNPLGDLLCVLAAMSWAGYTVFLKKIEAYGYDILMVTRRVFCMGLLFLLPFLPFAGFSPSWPDLLKPLNLLNLLFLGLGASALCFVTWNTAVKLIGPVKTSVYIYLSPAVTILAAFLLLRDPLLPMALLGAALTLAGLIISQRRR
ncbi:MAG: DMT family transporter [Clostridia bacterium]|nr:DMT family transporter [Clostridia bacterium]